MGVERCGLEGFRKWRGFYFFSRERELDGVGISNERAEIFLESDKFYFSIFFQSNW